MKPSYADEVIEVTPEEARGLLEMGVRVYVDWSDLESASIYRDDTGFSGSADWAVPLSSPWIDVKDGFYFVRKE